MRREREIEPIERLRIDRLIDPSDADTLAADVRRGFTSSPKWLPAKHLYDEEGGKLFEEICGLTEYYPTRTEAALLDCVAEEVMGKLRPRHLIELGSGSSMKTRTLLTAMGNLGRPATYHPIDINEALLTQTAGELVRDFPWLRVHGLVADFERPLTHLPSGPDVLMAFLGGTIGNFEPQAGDQLLRNLAQSLGAGSLLLIGTDMVKEPARLHAAYNDARGITARFNLNVLEVINRKLGADFDLAGFEHLAFYLPALQRVEMHLRSLRRQTVHVTALDLVVPFEEGETVRTEISRKFTAETARRMLARGGYAVLRQYTPRGGDYSLWLATAGEASELETAANPLA